MAGIGPILEARLRLDAKQFNATMTSTQRRMVQLGTSMKATGARMTASISAPLALAGAAASKVAVDFDRSMTKVESLVGVNRKQVDAWRNDLLKLGPAVGKTPTELAEALFAVTSAGARGAQALEILTGAAKASAVGLGETRDVAFAVVSAVNAYKKQGLSAAKATDVMVAAVRAGNLEASDLAGSLGNVMGIAAEMGVSFAETTAFIASFTKAGGDTRVAATSLVAVLSTFLKTTPQQTTALSNLGIEVQNVRDAIKRDGLAVAMVELIGSFKGNVDALGQIIPNLRAMRGALSTAASQGKDYIKIAREITNSQGITDRAFARTTQTMAHQFDVFKAQISVLGIALGNELAPMLLSATKWAGNYLDSLSKTELETRKMVAITLLAGVALGPFIAALGVTIKLLYSAGAGVLLLSTELKKLFKTIGVVGALLKGLLFVAKAISLVTTALGLLGLAAAGFGFENVRNFTAEWPLIGKAIDFALVKMENFSDRVAIGFIKANESLRGFVQKFYRFMADIPAFDLGFMSFDPSGWQQTADRHLGQSEAAQAGIRGFEASIRGRNQRHRGRHGPQFGPEAPAFIGPLLPGQSREGAGFDFSVAWQQQLEGMKAEVASAFDDVKGIIDSKATSWAEPVAEAIAQKGVSAVGQIGAFMKTSSDRLQDALDVTPAQKFATEIERGKAELERLFVVAEAGGEKAVEALQKLAVELKLGEEAGLVEFQNAWVKTTTEISEQAKKTGDEIKVNIGGAISSTMDEMFTGFLRGTRDLESLAEVWSNSMIGIVEDMFSQFIESKLNFDAIFEKNFMEDLLPMVKDFASQAMKAIGGLFGWFPSSAGQVSQIFGTPASNVGAPAGPGAFDFSGYAARGGITMGPSLAVVGDNPSGREAIIPLERWQEVMGGAGGAPEIHIHAPTALSQKRSGRDASGRRFMELIFEGAKGAVAEDIVRGGSVGRAISSTFGTQPTGGV